MFILFLGDVKGSDVARWLIVLFGIALGCTIGSLLAFLADTLLGWDGESVRRPRSSARAARFVADTGRGQIGTADPPHACRSRVSTPSPG